MHQCPRRSWGPVCSEDLTISEHKRAERQGQKQRRQSQAECPLEATGRVRTPPKGSHGVVTGSGWSSFCVATEIRRPSLCLHPGTPAGWRLVGLKQPAGSAACLRSRGHPTETKPGIQAHMRERHGPPPPSRTQTSVPWPRPHLGKKSWGSPRRCEK